MGVGAYDAARFILNISTYRGVDFEVSLVVGHDEVQSGECFFRRRPPW
jgi:hypothetical protein